MSLTNKIFSTLFISTLLSTVSTAQVLSTSVPNASAGDTIQVTYTDPTKAGEEVDIKIDNGNPLNPMHDSITVTVGEDGTVTENWVVPEWDGANFESDGAMTVSLGIF